MSKFKLLLTLFIIILILSGIGIGNYLLERVPENPSGTLGNTAGNLQNGGYFCEQDGVVYFANAYDNYSLHRMDPDESNLKKINSMGVKWINSAGKNLYFYQNDSSEGSGLGYVIKTTGLYRLDKKGNHATLLKRDAVGDVVLIDNYLYYQNLSENTITLDRIGIDRKNEATVLDYRVYPGSSMAGSIYYSNYNDNYYLYALDTVTGSNNLIWNHRVWNPVYHTDGYIYFMDLETDYQLHRYHPSSGSHEVLTSDRVDLFNVYGDLIYYQRSNPNDAALMRMYTNGSGQELVSSGNYQNINITSNYVYFNLFSEPTPVFRQSLTGPINVTLFQPIEE